MNVPLAVLFALAPLISLPAAASDMSDGECVHWVRLSCAAVHFDKTGHPSCIGKRQSRLGAGECADRAFGPDALREDDEEPDGLDEYARWRYASSPVSDDVLESMSPEMLRAFRNTFFAGHGRVFKDRGLDAYFRGFPWYKPRAGFREADLSDVEKLNAKKAGARETIVRKEAARSGARRMATEPFVPMPSK